MFDGYGTDNPLIMAGAGLCKTFAQEAIAPLAASGDAMVVGSITWDGRLGNTGLCQNFDNPLYGVNAWGMPNPGDYPPDLHMNSPEDKQHLAWRREKKLVLSLAEFTPMKYAGLYASLASWGNAIELNFGCPNVRDGGKQHKIVSFDPPTIARILDLVTLSASPHVTTGVKLSPYSDPGLLKEVAAVIAESEVVDNIVTCNTFPNGLVYGPDRKVVKLSEEAGKYGGISGEALKPISLSNAAQFAEAFKDLSSSVKVVRVGGISSGEDVYQSYDVGCVGVQMVTAVIKEGPRALARVREEYADIVG